MIGKLAVRTFLKPCKRLAFFGAIFVILFGLITPSVAYASTPPYKTYYYDPYGMFYASPHAYLPQKQVSGADMGLGSEKLSEVSDLVVDSKNNVYLAETGKSRIIVLDENFQLKFTLDSFVNDKGDEDSLNRPTGVFVTEEGFIYVADSKNQRIVVFNEDSTFHRIIGAPDSEVFTADFIYEPSAIAVDQAERIYVVSKSTNMGVIALNANGDFEGFIGAEQVEPRILDIFWDLITTREQRARTRRSVPTEYNNISIDSLGFPYVTSSAIDAEQQYNAMLSSDTSSRYSPIKRLNTNGIDVLRRNGPFGPGGDIQTRGGGVSRFIDVSIGENGTYSVLDSTRNKIFTYDDTGHLLYVFGGVGSQVGVFLNPVALAYKGTDILVVDQNTAAITVFNRTEYGFSIANAIQKQKERKYDEAVVAWENVLKLNSSYSIAYDGVANAQMRLAEYKNAMENYNTAANWLGYYKAFAEYRSEFLQFYILLIPAVIVLLYFLITFLSKKIKNVNENGWKKKGKRTLLDELLYSFHILFHPFDGFWDLKYEKRGSFRAALIILGLVIASYLFKDLVGGVLVASGSFTGEIDFQGTLMTIGLPLILWVTSNWCLTTLMDGKGSFKDIFIATSYSLVPFIFVNIPVAIISNFITMNEYQFIVFFDGIAIGWAFLLIFFGVLVTNAYGFLKNIVTSAISVMGMGFMAFLGILFITLIQKMYSFGSTIVAEIMFRI